MSEQKSDITDAAGQIWSWLAEVPDPEVPAVSVVDLGIVREVRWSGDSEQECVVVVTPTYSGCPATEVISNAIRETLIAHGVPLVRVEMRLAPAWTTDWLSPDAHEKLRLYGIAPPSGSAEISKEQVIDLSLIRRKNDETSPIACPNCGSLNTEIVSQFGSTPCKSLRRCLSCKEPFDYFKRH